MKISLNKTSVIHPFLFAFFPVIFLVSYNIDLLLLQEIVLPSLTILTMAFVIWFVLGKKLKNWRKSGFIVSLGIVLFFSFGHLFNLTYGCKIGDFLFCRTLVLWPIFLMLFVLGTIYFVKTKRKLDNATTITNVIAITLVVISSVNIITYNLEGGSSLNIMNEVEKDLATNISSIQKLPNIYYIILDEYGRDDILLEQLDFDNREFISFLSSKGFFVAPNSHSNYAKTNISLASSLNMKYVNYTRMLPTSEENTPYEILISDNELMKYLKSKGYTTINLSSGWRLTEKLVAADENLCFTDKHIDSEFLLILVRSTMLLPVSSDYFEKEKREVILCSFSELSQIHKKFESPVFVFAHFVLPHAPYVFGPNGELAHPDILRLEQERNKKGYLDQLHFANKKITEFVNEILNDNNNLPIIIIQGDHGTGFTTDLYNLTDEMMKERSPIFNAYYLPGNPKSLPYDSISPVNSFRVVFNAYLDENFELLEDRIYLHRAERNTYVFYDSTDYVMGNVSPSG